MRQFRQEKFRVDRHRRTATLRRHTAGVIGAVLVGLLLLAPPSKASEIAGPSGDVAPTDVSVPAVEPSAEAPTPAEVVAVPEGPQLSIGIDNGRTSTTTGDQLDYVITVQNLGTADVDGLLINQSLPTGMDFSTADSGGTADAGYVTWTVDLKATTTATFHTTMTVTATPAELLRLASVACASISANSPPIVCASHSDQLPAGASAEAAQQSMAAPPAAETQPWWYVLAGLAVFVVLGGLVAWWVIRRRRPAQPEEADALALTR